MIEYKNYEIEETPNFGGQMIDVRLPAEIKDADFLLVALADEKSPGISRYVALHKFLGRSEASKETKEEWCQRHQFDYTEFDMKLERN